MRVLVTGATGFVGPWLLADLRSNDHAAIAGPSHADVDINERDALASLIRSSRPDAIVHLAAVASPRRAAGNPDEAFRVNVSGTVTLFEALRLAERQDAHVLVTGSAAIYGHPRPEDLPLNELSVSRPVGTYALSKAGQEAVAIEYGFRFGFPVTVTRSFNHTGPGQSTDFVVPALAARVAAYKLGHTTSVEVGNLHVRRDITDVRDVVRAYRLLVEMIPAAGEPRVVNVASGRAVSIRELLTDLCDIGEVEPPMVTAPDMVRADEAPEIRGDPSFLKQLTDWGVTVPLAQTLADVFESQLLRVDSSLDLVQGSMSNSGVSA